MKRVRAILVIAAVVVTMLATTVSPAFAGNPHFIKNATSVSLSGSSLFVTFKEAGLPSGAHETITLRAIQTITYESVNNGGFNPSASNKHTTQSQSSTSGEFTADKNGNINGSLTLAPLGAAAVGFSSPPGQTTVLVSVTYSNITLVDETSGASMSIPGIFTYTNSTAPPVR